MIDVDDLYSLKELDDFVSIYKCGWTICDNNPWM